ncbi:MAG: hypothetical protein IJM71_03055 [Clostridia bacterium]|nr:hypothetical protein [Clostridia bacterium]
MEYYFSWDEVHGFNFAVRNKPVVVQQVLEMADGACPQDDFARNTAYVINFKTDDGNSNLFYALAKRTDNGKYLEGFYTGTLWNQLGATHNYDPEQEEDYVISYGDDGYVTIEWSIPLNNFFVSGGGEGSVIEGTISATAGTAVVPFGGHDNEDSYAVTLGDFGYGVDSRFMKNHVAYRLTGETIPVEPASIDQTSEPDQAHTSTPAPVSTDDPNTIPVDNRNANENGNENINATNSVAPRTGDPMITISAVSALSLAGIIVIRKKRR